MSHWKRKCIYCVAVADFPAHEYMEDEMRSFDAWAWAECSMCACACIRFAFRDFFPCVHSFRPWALTTHTHNFVLLFIFRCSLFSTVTVQLFCIIITFVADAAVVVSSLSHFLDALPHSHPYLSRLVSFHFMFAHLFTFYYHLQATSPCLAVFMPKYPHRFGIGSVTVCLWFRPWNFLSLGISIILLENFVHAPLHLDRDTGAIHCCHIALCIWLTNVNSDNRIHRRDTF